MERDEAMAFIQKRGYKIECDETGWYFSAADAAIPHIIGFYSDNEEHAVDSMLEWLAAIDLMTGNR